MWIHLAEATTYIVSKRSDIPADKGIKIGYQAGVKAYMESMVMVGMGFAAS
jgi:hypothetical protein